MNRFLYFLLLGLFFIPEYYSQTTTLTTGSGSGTGTWTVPCGVTSVTIECWGAGGGGGADPTSNAIGGAGGSGGANTTTVVPVSANQVLTYTVGAGGAAGNATSNGGPGGATTFSGSTFPNIVANGGLGGAANSAAATGTVGGSGGTVTAGGAGAGGGANGGAGGAGGGVGGGAGGAGATGGNNNAVAGSVPGGGGGGADDEGGADNDGAAGGNGRITIAYIFPDVNAVASSTLASCVTTTAALTATAITAPGWSGGWQCVGCTGVTIASPTSATTTASGFAPGSTNYFQWVVTYTATGCSVYDDLNITVPACAITNNDCASATVLTVNAGLMCGQSTTGASVQVGECYDDLSPPNAGLSAQSLWYRFTATNDSLVLNVAAYGTNGPPSITVFGPFGAGAGCLPSCASTITTVEGLTQDPGVHKLLTGLATTGNNQYLVSVTGFANLNWDFCINLANPAVNSVAPSNALVISNCGATFNGSTNGGYYPSGTSAGFNNLDANAGTTVGGASEAGDDVTFVVNNLSWFKFCSVNAGTYNVQFDVLSCAFSGASSGSQMAILTGTNTNMTNIWQAANPTQVGTAIQTSPNFSLAAGGCAYLVVDGFAGDACSYSYLLTNVSGGCVLLPIELISFNAISREETVDLTWATASEKNNNYYSLERSDDGINFELIETILGAGTTADAMFYSSVDRNPLTGTSYYRLKQTDYDHNYTYSKIISVERANKKDLTFEIVPNPNTEHMATSIQLNFVPNGELTISIQDINGILLYESKEKPEATSIKIPNEFSKGVYLVKIINKDFVQTKRMLIR